MRDLCCVLMSCCIPGVGRDRECPYHRGQIHFHLGWLPKGSTAAPAACRRNDGVYSAQVLTKGAPHGHGAGQGEMGKEHREKLSPPKGQPEVPQECLLCTQGAGRAPRRGSKYCEKRWGFPCRFPSHCGGPQLSPCRRLELFSRIILQEQSTQLG